MVKEFGKQQKFPLECLFLPDARHEIVDNIFNAGVMSSYIKNPVHIKIIVAIIFAHIDLDLNLNYAIINFKFDIKKSEEHKKANKYWKEKLCKIKFATKLEMAYLCDLLNEKDKDDLKCINDLRNDIAHGYARIHDRPKRFYCYKGGNILTEDKALTIFCDDYNRIKNKLFSNKIKSVK